MSLNRRTFLELTSGWIGDGGTSAVARVTHGDYFVARDIGVAFRRPPNWVFIPPEVLSAECRDISEASGAKIGNPSVMNISKEQWATNPKRFTPGINIWVRPLQAFREPRECLLALERGQSFYPDYRHGARPRVTSLTDGDVWECTAFFTFVTKGLDRPTPVRCRLVVATLATHYLNISLCDGPDIDVDMEESEAFQEFLETLRYVTNLDLAN